MLVSTRTTAWLSVDSLTGFVDGLLEGVSLSGCDFMMFNPVRLFTLGEISAEPK